MTTAAAIEDISEPDWSKILQYPPAELTCRCRKRWHGYAKTVPLGQSIVLLSKDPCPGCGSRTNITTVRTQPERQTLG